MAKLDFLFSTPKNQYLDQALPPISRNPAPLFDNRGMVTGSKIPQTVAARPRLSNELMMALTGRNMTRPMPLPTSRPRRPAMPTSRPARPSPMPIPTSKPTLSGPAPDFVKMPMPTQPVAPQPAAPQPAAPQGFFEGLLGSGFDDPRTQGIMAASAALLEAGGPVVGAPAPSLGQGIGRAMTAYSAGRTGAMERGDARSDAEFNKQYKELQMKEMEKRLGRADDPILTDIQGGAFTRVTDPVTGESKIVANDEVQAFLEEKAKRASAGKTVNVRLTEKSAEKQVEDLSDIDTKRDLIGQMDDFITLIQNGELDFGVGEGFEDSATLRGINPMASEVDKIEARNSQSFDRFIDSLRNALLTLQKGVQTEGDAQRIKNELITGLEANDTQAVLQALQELKQKQNQSIVRLKKQIQNRRKEAGVGAYAFSPTADDITFEKVK